MILNNEFTVGADVETVWRHLLDMEGVASCLPGATVTATDEENTYDGTMRLKVGPMKVEYRGRAILQHVDEQRHTSVISLEGHEARGQGTAMATIHNQLEEVVGGTRVRAQTDFNITGPQAQFGRGVIEDVGGRVMAEFSRQLERRIAAGDFGSSARSGAGSGSPGTGEISPAVGQAETPPGPGSDARESAPRVAAAGSDEALDVGAFLPPRVARGAAGIVAALALALILLWRKRR
jgi:uncharacterized protein